MTPELPSEMKPSMMDIGGLEQDRSSNSSVLAMKSLQSCTTPSHEVMCQNENDLENTIKMHTKLFLKSPWSSNLHEEPTLFTIRHQKHVKS